MPELTFANNCKDSRVLYYPKSYIEGRPFADDSQTMNRTRAQTDFLKAELETGLTFATIAEQASDEGKINRNRDNARKAYLSARRFISGISLSDKESAELQKNAGGTGESTAVA